MLQSRDPEWLSSKKCASGDTLISLRNGNRIDFKGRLGMCGLENSRNHMGVEDERNDYEGK